MKRFASASLALELATTVLLALVLSNAATFTLFANQRAREVRFVRLDMAEARLAALASLLPNVSAELQDQFLFSASGRGARIAFGAQPIVPENEPRNPDLEARFARALQPLGEKEIRVAFREGEIRSPPRPHEASAAAQSGSKFRPLPPSPPMVTVSPEGRIVPVRRFAIAAKLADGRWLNAQFALPRPDTAVGALLESAVITALALVAASLWMAFRFAGPLRRLAEASASLRPGEPIPAVAERGPNALKDVIRAFNAMSKRLMATLEGQRSMLAAIAHDLRTPITSLRLRVELLDDGEVKERMQNSLDELQDTTEAAVDALKAEGAGETTRPMDVRALIESLCTDLADLREKVTFLPAEPVSCRCRPHEIRRAVRNLIENAVRYGGLARVRLERLGNNVVVAVEDDGPGIPPADLEHVFEPFRRLEESRSRETGGHGLGLTIARSIARGHGGDITLVNRPGGGLTATLSFPLR